MRPQKQFIHLLDPSCHTLTQWKSSLKTLAIFFPVYVGITIPWVRSSWMRSVSGISPLIDHLNYSENPLVPALFQMSSGFPSPMKNVKTPTHGSQIVCSEYHTWNPTALYATLSIQVCDKMQTEWFLYVVSNVHSEL